MNEMTITTKNKVLSQPAHEALEAGERAQGIFSAVPTQVGVPRRQLKAAHHIQAVGVQILQAAFKLGRLQAGDILAQRQVALAQLVVLFGFAAWVNHYRQNAQHSDQYRQGYLSTGTQLQGGQSGGAAGDKHKAKQQPQQLVQLAVAVVEFGSVVDVHRKFGAALGGHGVSPQSFGGGGSGEGCRCGGTFFWMQLFMFMASCVGLAVLSEKLDANTGGHLFSRRAGVVV